MDDAKIHSCIALEKRNEHDEIIRERESLYLVVLFRTNYVTREEEEEDDNYKRQGDARTLIRLERSMEHDIAPDAFV